MRISKTHHNTFVIIRNLLICLTLLFGAMALPASDRVAVFASPWSSEAEVMNVIADADGTFVNAGKKDWIAIAQSDQNNFAFKLYKSGALLVLNADFAAACLPTYFFNSRST